MIEINNNHEILVLFRCRTRLFSKIQQLYIPSITGCVVTKYPNFNTVLSWFVGHVLMEWTISSKIYQLFIFHSKEYFIIVKRWQNFHPLDLQLYYDCKFFNFRPVLAFQWISCRLVMRFTYIPQNDTKSYTEGNNIMNV